MIKKIFYIIVHILAPLILLGTVFVFNSVYAKSTNDITEIPDEKQVIFHRFPEKYHYRATRCIVKDSKGYMWFGTENGVLKFDGINLTVYEHDPISNNSISNNDIYTLAEDYQNNIWVGTEVGLNFYNRNLNKFDKASALINDSILDRAHISAMAVGNDDSVIWVGTHSQGLYCYNIGKSNLFSYFVEVAQKRELNITCILPVSKSIIWIGTQSGLLLFNKSTGHSRWFYTNSANPFSISGNNITSIEKDQFGDIWVGTQDNGINRIVYNRGAVQFEKISIGSTDETLGNAVNDIFADNKGNLWIGTENDGLKKISIETGLVESYRNVLGNDNTIGSNSVWTVYGDDEGRIWTGSYSKGVSVLDPLYSKFESYKSNPHIKKGLPVNDVRGFAETACGNKVWVVTDGGGISRFDISSRSFDLCIDATNTKKLLTSNMLQSIVIDNDNYIWLGSWGGGIDKLSADGDKIKNYSVECYNGIGNNKIRVLNQGNQGNIWAGTNGSGLYLYNAATDSFKIVTFKNILTDRSYVSSIISYSDTEIIVGTLSGLVVLTLNENKKILNARKYTAENTSLNSNAINSIWIDRYKTIWLGTSTGGVNVFNLKNGSFHSINKTDGLCSNNISSIVGDKRGRVWVSTNNGITRISPLTSELTTFSKADGLNSNQFYSKSSLITNNGLLFFGSEQGFNIINPEHIIKNKSKPDVVITDLNINNMAVGVMTDDTPFEKHISETDTLILSHTQSTFSIRFVALNYTRPGQNHFSYKLEGFDDKWNYTGDQNTANYTKVAPGDYIFMVKGANNDGVWNDTPKTLVISISPPFWKTKWAFILYMLSFFSLSFIVLRFWYQRFQIKNQLRLEKLEKKKEQELNERNLQFFTTISHELRTPLSLIIGPVESMLKSVPSNYHKQLKLVQRNSYRLLSLTNNLMDIRKLEDGGMKISVKKENIEDETEHVIGLFKDMATQKQIDLKTKYPKNLKFFHFDVEKYHTILINILGNAVKFTPKQGAVEIGISYEERVKLLKVDVANTGQGIKERHIPYLFEKFYQADSPENNQYSGSGVGLALTKGLVELHGGEIWATSTYGEITHFTFTISVDQSLFLQNGINSKPRHKDVPEVIFNDDEFDLSGSGGFNEDIEKPLILIVEDSTDLRFFLKSELQETYNIVFAENGIDGILRAKEHTPDLIISDIVMPGASGYELCGNIKSDVRTSHIPVILLTAKTATDEQIEGFESGADAYITKPFQLNLLKVQVENLIQSRKDLYARFTEDVHVVSKKKYNDAIDREFLQLTVNYILKNLSDTKINIERLSQLHKMSHRNFYRKIKALTGNTVVEFIKNVRLKEAFKMMKTEEHNLAEISYMTGFSSPSYFSKSFREYYGESPSFYLKK